MGPRGGERAQGGGRALDPRDQVLAPPDVFSVLDILMYSRKKKSYLGYLENFYFRGIFYFTDKLENRQKILFFSLFNINNRK